MRSHGPPTSCSASEAVDIITIVLGILLVKRLSDCQLQRRLMPADAADTILR